MRSEQERKYQREKFARYANDPEMVAKKRKRDAERYRRIKNTPEYQERMQAWKKQNRLNKNDPFKELVRSQTNRAVKLGFIDKKPCEVCACDEVEAHHDDYNQPFAVRWLCRRHHSELHMIERRIEKGMRTDFLNEELRAIAAAPTSDGR